MSSFRLTNFKLKRIRNLLFILLLIFSSSSSPIVYNHILELFQTNKIQEDNLLNISSAPVITVNSPTNYTLFGKVAPNYSITITGGPGNYTWYEFLDNGENSSAIELSGLLDENVNKTFDQDLWDNLANGTVIVRFYANDSSNSIGYTDAIIRLDNIAPEPPNALGATPSTWTNVDSFNISWSNPPDSSGIIGAYYKLDNPPTSDNNGTYVAGVDIESISDITVSTEGEHDIYLWLVDAVGNVNYSAYSSTELSLDSLDPAKPTSLLATPSSWTSSDSFNISWSNPTDTSGIIGAYFKLDDAPTSDNNGTYVAGVDIESISNISVSTEGIHDVYVWLVDAAGNVNYSAYAITQLYLDTTDPYKISSLTASPTSWTNVNSFNLSWSNPTDTSGIVGAYYKLYDTPTYDDDGIYVAGVDIETIVNITVSIEGMHDIYVWLVDAAGNVNYSAYASTQLYLDSMVPLAPSTLESTPISWTDVNSFNLSWSNPSDTSGIIGAYYKLDDAPTSDDDGTYIAGVNIESIVNITVSMEGMHDIYVWLVDAAGNINYSAYASTQLYLDTTNPSKVSSLAASPTSWTNVNSFNISWSNPFDTSGIIGAYYKLDDTPISDNDGTYVAGVDIESILNITVSTEGMHNVYVWLVDAAGNINYSAYASTQLYLDTIDPSEVDSLAASPTSWTNFNSFNISWSNPPDTSSIVGAYYKLYDVPTSDDDGTYVAGMDIESIVNITVSNEGMHNVYVWLVDAAGNVNYSAYVSTQLYLDATDPSIVGSLVASPSSWTSVNSYNLSWSNPSDTSGIVGAYYKLYDVPTSDDDGTYVAGVDIESILNITVSTESMHNVYVWLVDAAGNINYSAYASTQLYLDSMPPTAPSTLE
ncbi:MAG: hypothetical protein ACFFFT_14520, partial [Candidatus Thorarchaeota archaeon]